MPPSLTSGGGNASTNRAGIVRLALTILWSINIVSVLAALSFVVNLTFSLGMFYAAGMLFFPLFEPGDLRQSLILSLPMTAFCLVIIFTVLIFTPFGRKRDPEETRPRAAWRRWTSHVGRAIGGVGLFLVLGDIWGIGSAGVMLSTSATAFLAARSRKKVAGASRLAALASLAVSIMPILFLALSGVFWLGYIGVESKIDQFESSRTYLEVGGKLKKIAVLVPGKSRSLFYDGVAVRTGGKGFLNNVIVHAPRHRSSLLCAIIIRLDAHKIPEVCG